MRTEWGASLVVVAVLLGGCSGSSSGPAAPSPEPRVELGFTQLLPDEGTRWALLRVSNVGDDPLVMAGAGLDWPGYGGSFTSPQDATIAADHTLDLQVRLPVADCDPDADLDAAVRGIVRTADREVVQPLEDSGQVFVRRLHDTWCADRLLAENVRVSYADDWRVAGGVRRGEPAAVGSLVLTRQGGAEPVVVTAADGTVLYDLGVDTPVSVPPTRRQVGVAAAILPGNRCDEHARGQATAPWTLALSVRVGSGPTARDARVLVEPPARVRQRATRALDEACALRADG